jgi:hypothetical protein
VFPVLAVCGALSKCEDRSDYEAIGPVQLGLVVIDLITLPFAVVGLACIWCLELTMRPLTFPLQAISLHRRLDVQGVGQRRL